MMREPLIVGDGEQGEHSISIGTVEGLGPVVWFHHPDKAPEEGLCIGVPGIKADKWLAVCDAIEYLEEHARRLKAIFDRACPPEDETETALVAYLKVLIMYGDQVDGADKVRAAREAVRMLLRLGRSRDAEKLKRQFGG